VVVVILFFGVLFLFVLEIKNLHLLFAEILRHKPTLHDFGVVVFPSKNPDVRHGDRSTFLFAQLQCFVGSTSVSININVQYKLNLRNYFTLL